MSLASLLEAGRRDFLEAAHNLSSQQASAKPSPERWSILECIEHVVTVESRFLGWIAAGAAAAPPRDEEKEMRIYNSLRNRESKFEAPEAVRPQGRFETIDAALAEFNAARDRSLQVVQERGDTLYSIGATHSRFGKLNGVEVIHLIDGHARRHAEQIRETREALARA